MAALAADIRAGVVQLLLPVAFCMAFLLFPNQQASAQIFDAIEAVIKKALVAADLKIQRLQTQTLVLQNAQKALENSMQDGFLDDINSWIHQQEEQYNRYYQELWQVKNVIASYSKVSYLIRRQAQLVQEYQRAWNTIQRDSHFTPSEIAHIGNVYNGILNESIRNIDQLSLAIKSLVTQMDDAARLRIIDESGTRINQNYQALRQYTQSNTLLSLQRAKDEQDLKSIRTLYGIQ